MVVVQLAYVFDKKLNGKMSKLHLPKDMSAEKTHYLFTKEADALQF